MSSPPLTQILAQIDALKAQVNALAPEQGGGQDNGALRDNSIATDTGASTEEKPMRKIFYLLVYCMTSAR